jgi:hypothetical protein
MEEDPEVTRGLAGIVLGLLEDYRHGFLDSVRELVHADLFSDYLDMAGHLIDEGYKDPAAVIVGSSLEAHLRKLCDKHGVATTRLRDGKDVSLTTDMLNAELARDEKAYGKNEQKSVTAWLGIRNDAAHGHYDNYTAEQVKLLLMSVKDFISRYPA